MPAPAAPAAAVAAVQQAAGGQARQGQRDGGRGWQDMVFGALKTWVIVTVATQGIKYFFDKQKGGQTPAAPQVAVSNPASASGSSSGPVTTAPVNGSAVPNAMPLWPQGTVFDAHLYITAPPHSGINFDNPSYPHTTFTGLVMGDWKWKESWTTEVKLPKDVQRNGTLFLDTILVRNGSPINPVKPGFNHENVRYVRKALMNYQRQKRIRVERNLISGGDQEVAETLAEAEEKDKAMPIISYYHPNVSLTLVSNAGPFPISGLQPQIAQHVQFVPPAAGDTVPRYQPIVFANTFWQLKSGMYPINETVTTVPLHVTFQPIGVTKWQIFATMDESFKAASEQQGMGADMDEFKRVLLETNPILLATTVIVTVLHMLFEMLAFKNDVSHWRNTKSQVGVSLRTIITNVVVQLIITLYLFDNSTDTSWMILFSQGMGLLIEAWKITKAVDIRLVPNPAGVLPYKVEIKDKHELSKEEQETKEYDKLAFRYVGIGFAPFMVAYTIYSLIYESHRGWYSFTISTLTQAVHLFGFALMIPQLIINYKLKSVAHLPMRSLTYKFLNTIVDDFFSFVIKMPTLHRIACFRDDVVFVILLYQMYIYKVDYKRANEYSQVGTDYVEKEKSEQVDEIVTSAITATALDSRRVEPEKEKQKAEAVSTVRKDESKKDI